MGAQIYISKFKNIGLDYLWTSFSPSPPPEENPFHVVIQPAVQTKHKLPQTLSCLTGDLCCGKQQKRRYFMRTSNFTLIWLLLLRSQRMALQSVQYILAYAWVRVSGKPSWKLTESGAGVKLLKWRRILVAAQE